MNCLNFANTIFAAALVVAVSVSAQVLTPKNPGEIAAGEFAGRSDLKAVTIPEGVKAIGADAFNGCSNLEEITLPASVKSVGKTAFDKCPKLKAITYGGTKKEWEELCGSKNFGVFNGFFLDAKTTCKDGVYEGHLELVVKAGKGKTATAEKEFMHRVDIKSVEVEDGIKTIGRDSFAECVNMTALKLPKSVRVIDVGAFAVCSKLERVEIPEGVERIGDWSFSDCWQLKEVTIPASVKRIDAGAFALCPKIETVKFLGSEAEWKKIKIAGNNSDLTNAKLVFAK